MTLMVATAEAPAPALATGSISVPSRMTTFGAVAYPEPGLVMVMPVIAPLASIVASAWALMPLGSSGMSKSTVGNW